MKPYSSIALALLIGAGSVAFADNATMSMNHMNKMQSHMQHMGQEMAAIKQIKNPAERRLQMRAHLEKMKTMMNDMHKSDPNMSESAMRLHMQMLEKRLDLLQDMMTQVVEVQTVTFPEELNETD